MRIVTILTAACAACAAVSPRAALAQSARGSDAASASSAATESEPAAPSAPVTVSATPSDAKLACIAAFEGAQRERNAGHFLASRAALIQCSEPQCGEVLAAECTRMFADVEAATPSVVFSAHDTGRNMDRSDVAVSVDGKQLLERLDGKPFPIDPGEYELTFSAPGVAPVKLPVVIRTGEKYRVINVVFSAPARPQPGPAPAAAPVEPQGGGVPVLSYVLAGVGLAGVGTFVGLRVIGASDYDAMKDTCAPNCLDSDIDNLKLKYLLSNVALGVGAASLGAAIVIYAASPSGPAEPAATLALVPAPGGSRMVFDARF